MTDPQPQTGPRAPSVVLLGVLAAAGPLSLSVHVQSIPAIAAEFASPYTLAQLTVSLFLASFAVTQLVVGPLSDKFGRRPVLFAGLALYFAASVGAALAGSIEVLVAARILQGAGACATLVTPRAVIQDSFQGTEAARMMALMSMLQSSAPPLAPVLGGLLDAAFGWRAIFWALAALALALMLAVALWLAETKPARGGDGQSWGEIFGRYLRLLRSRLYIGYTLAFAAGTAGFFGFLAIGPGLLIGARGLSPLEFSLVLMATAGQFVIASWTASKLIPRMGLSGVITLGAAGMAAAGVVLFALSGLESLAAVIAPVIVYAFFNGMIFPTALAGATGVDRRVAGSAASFLGFAQLGIGSLVALAVAAQPTDTPVPFAVTILVLAGLVALGLALVRTAAR